MSIQANFPAIKPTLLLDFANTEALDPRITFTRASTGTYYDGKTVAKAEENLLTFSEQFDNAAWGKNNLAATGNNAVAPDGTTTADTITAAVSASSGKNFAQSASIAGQAVFSVYVKQGTHRFVQLFANSDTFGQVNFDLLNGTLSATTATGSITAVGNSWYRCTALFAPSITLAYVAMVTSLTSARAEAWTSVGTETFFVWGAQLEQRASATAYTPTTTQAVTNYIPVLLTAASGVPRFEHNPVTGESLGLEIEEQRTNLVTYSEQFDNAAWVKTRANVTANSVIAPDGTLTGDKLAVDTTAATTHRLNYTTTLSAVAHTASCFAKKAELNYLILQLNTVANSLTWFDLNAGTVSTLGANVTASITPAGNGWYKCSITGTVTAGTNDVVVYPSETNATPTTAVANGFSGIYIWGAQLEAGAFPTSYIPTVASQVTRAADSAVMTGANFSSWYRQGQGTLFADFVSITPTLSGVFNFQDSAGSNAIGINTNALGSNTVRMSVDFNGSTQYSNSATATTNSNIKTAFAYATNNFASAVNGGAVNSSSSGTVPSASLTAYIGDIRASFSKPLNGTIRKIAYYPVRVTNAQLQALTS